MRNSDEFVLNMPWNYYISSGASHENVKRSILCAIEVTRSPYKYTFLDGLLEITSNTLIPQLNCLKCIIHTSKQISKVMEYGTTAALPRSNHQPRQWSGKDSVRERSNRTKCEKFKRGWILMQHLSFPCHPLLKDTANSLLLHCTLLYCITVSDVFLWK